MLGTVLLLVAATASGAHEISTDQQATIKAGDWTILENCQLIDNRCNDGDSFRVRHNDKEYVFRLYYVDAPETYGVRSSRVLNQASYFGIAPEKALEVGKEARQFTEEKLKKPFTIYTRWRRALGNGELPRHFAFVAISDGDDLASLLARNGLVRIHGVSVGKKFNIPIPDNGKYRHYMHRLYSAQKKAKNEQAGGWIN